MTRRSRKKKSDLKKARVGLMGILNLFVLIVFCFAVWHGVQHGFTATTIICGVVIVVVQFVAGSIGGPVVREWIEKRKQAKLQNLKNSPHF